MRKQIKKPNPNNNNLSSFEVDHSKYIISSQGGYTAFQGSKSEHTFRSYSLARSYVKAVILAERLSK